MLAFVLNHPLTDRWTRTRTEHRLAELAPDLPLDAWTAAREKGKAGELEGIVVEVLSHRDAWLAQANENAVVVSGL